MPPKHHHESENTSTIARVTSNGHGPGLWVNLKWVGKNTGYILAACGIAWAPVKDLFHVDEAKVLVAPPDDAAQRKMFEKTVLERLDRIERWQDRMSELSELRAVEKPRN